MIAWEGKISGGSDSRCQTVATVGVGRRGRKTEILFSVNTIFHICFYFCLCYCFYLFNMSSLSKHLLSGFVVYRCKSSTTFIHLLFLLFF